MLLLGLIELDGEIDNDALKLGEVLVEGEAEPLGLIDPDNDALGDNDDTPTPSGVISGSRNLHAT